MNFIKYGDNNFHGNSKRYGKDGLLIDGQVEQRVALFGNELTADSLTFIVNSRNCAGENFGYSFLLDLFNRPLKTSDGKYLIAKNVFPDYRNYTAGTPLDLYNEPDGEIIGRFYVEDVTQISRKTVKFTCTDCIGMLAKMEPYNGGLWGLTPRKKAGAIIDEIMAGSGIEYVVESEVADTEVIGHLPRENRRTSLGKVLVAIGASVIEKKGVMNIVFLGGGQQTTVSQSDIYLQGGEVRKQTLATLVQVTEHDFYTSQDDEEVTLFDNREEGISVTNELVVFQEPCHNLKWDGGSIPVGWDYGVNYCYVTGVGSLTGKKYTHATRVVEFNTGANSTENIVSIENNELINLYNANLVARRMMNYYGLQTSIDYEQLDEEGTLAAGTPVNIIDPFGVARAGWIRSKSFPIGNKTKAKMNVLVGWVGGPYGGVYNSYREFRAADITNGTMAIPADMQGKDALIFLFGGGGGGQAGYDGEDGHYYTGTLTNLTGRGEPVAGGKGGAGGAAGSRAYFTSFQVQSLPASYSGAAIGIGGNGGVSNGELGQDGGVTTLNGHASTDGQRAILPIINLIDGKQYCYPNGGGTRGGDGGIGSGYDDTGKDTSTDGESIVGRAGGHYSNGMMWTMGAPYRIFASAGAGGGGAAYRATGSNGFSGIENTTTFGAIGGDGANAAIPIAYADETSEGRGGHGGGGGGGATAGSWNEQGGTIHYDRGTGGTGGKGSAGQKGGDGLIVIYYNA